MRRLPLDDTAQIQVGQLPESLCPDGVDLGGLWELHPPGFHELLVHGRRVHSPRWQQAYGADYRYAGNISRALPVPAMVQPFADWVRREVDDRINSVLANWYDASLGHYIARHRDSVSNMVYGAPIVTISLGEKRRFRMRPWKKNHPLVEFDTGHGSVCVIPYAVNLRWTHEIPRFKADRGKRISLTFRAFKRVQTTAEHSSS